MLNQPYKKAVLKIEFRAYAQTHYCYCDNSKAERLAAENAIHTLTNLSYVTSIDLVAEIEPEILKHHYSKITEFLNQINTLENE